MKDVSLDDLIKKDKEKGKQQRSNKPKQLKERAPGRRIIKGRRIQGPASNGKLRLNRNNRNQLQNKGNRDFKRSTNFKHQNRDQRRINDRRNERKQNQKKQTPRPKQQKPKQEKGRTLKVLGLHPDITNSDLYKLFSGEGALEKCMIEQDNFGRNLPSAIVKYHSSEHAKSAQQKFNSHKVMNSVLTVQPYKNTRT